MTLGSNIFYISLVKWSRILSFCLPALSGVASFSVLGGQATRSYRQNPNVPTKAGKKFARKARENFWYILNIIDEKMVIMQCFLIIFIYIYHMRAKRAEILGISPSFSSFCCQNHDGERSEPKIFRISPSFSGVLL